MPKRIFLSILFVLSSFIYANTTLAITLSKQEILNASHSGRELNDWYKTKTAHCGASGGPGYLCSGLFIRTTDSQPGFFPWDPSPWSLRVNGISFSWIRSDFNFTKFPLHSNGYILYPQDFAPSVRQYKPMLRCAYPFDAHTWGRAEPCGAQGKVKQSFPCDTINIHSADDWVKNFKSINNDRRYQCSFSFSKPKASVYNLGELIKARYQIDADNLKNMNNEFVFSAWPTGTGRNLPIHSFFYIDGSKAALDAAQSDQNRFYENYRIFIPVVKMVIPKELTGLFEFSFSKNDQGKYFSPL